MFPSNPRVEGGPCPAIFHQYIPYLRNVRFALYLRRTGKFTGICPICPNQSLFTKASQISPDFRGKVEGKLCPDWNEMRRSGGGG
jgi:hypothetical protein